MGAGRAGGETGPTASTASTASTAACTAQSYASAGNGAISGNLSRQSNYRSLCSGRHLRAMQDAAQLPVGHLRAGSREPCGARYYLCSGRETDAGTQGTFGITGNSQRRNTPPYPTGARLGATNIRTGAMHSLRAVNVKSSMLDNVSKLCRIAACFRPYDAAAPCGVLRRGSQWRAPGHCYINLFPGVLSIAKTPCHLARTYQQCSLVRGVAGGNHRFFYRQSLFPTLLNQAA